MTIEAQPGCEHSWYVFDVDSDRIWWACTKRCGAQKTTATASRHLNNAIAACYSDVGPSAALADIRTAMKLLEIEEEYPPRPWEHWNAHGEQEWESP